MHITKVVIKNYICSRDCMTLMNDNINTIVGNNECGKSTLLETLRTVACAINGIVQPSTNEGVA